jgi:hypothetical protein
VTCCKELCLVVKVGVSNSILKRNDSWTNSAQRKNIMVPMSRVKKIPIIFRCCRNYPPRDCSWRHHSETVSITYLVWWWNVCRQACAMSETSSLNQKLAVVTRQRARFLRVECETSLWSNIPLLSRFGTSRLYSLPEGETGAKGERFSDISDIQCGVTELLHGVSLQDFQRALGNLCKLCGVVDDCVESL